MSLRPTPMFSPLGVSVRRVCHIRSTISGVSVRRAKQWPAGFRRNLLVLVCALSLGTLAVAGYSAWQVRTLTTVGVTTQATALGPAHGGPDSGVYVRFLWGSEAHIGTAASPLWEPPHGSRVQVAFLPSDPPGSVAIVDQRAGGGYVVPAGAALAGAACLVAAVASARRRKARHNP